MDSFMAVSKQCPKCGKNYLINHQSAECPHKRLCDLQVPEEAKLTEIIADIIGALYVGKHKWEEREDFTDRYEFEPLIYAATNQILNQFNAASEKAYQKGRADEREALSSYLYEYYGSDNTIIEVFEEAVEQALQRGEEKG